MDKQKVKEILDSYIVNFDWLADVPQEEIYKWQSAYYAQQIYKAWSVGDCDLYDMLKEVRSKSYNLIDNGSVQPMNGLLKLCNPEKHKEYNKAVRGELVKLLEDDHGDIEKRQDKIETFITNINHMLDKIGEGGWRYKQDLRSTVTLLGLLDPEDNYIYKATPKSYFVNYTNHEDVGNGIDFSLVKYYKMCDDLKSFIMESEIPQLLDQCLVSGKMERLYGEKGPFPGEKLLAMPGKYNLLVYDVLYCSQNYQLCGVVKAKSQKERQAETVSRELSEYREQLAEKQELLESVGESIGVEARSLRGCKTRHKMFGEGTIVAVEASRIVVQFAEEAKKFLLPDAIVNGFILVDDDIKTKMTTYKAYRKELESEIRNINLEIFKRNK